MQKVVQRSKIAARRAAERLQKEKEHIAAGQAWSRQQDAQRLRKFNSKLIVDARKRRHEDWMAGPLAPRRDVADETDTYGSVPIYNFQLPDKHPKDRPRWLPITEGDRVLVVRGREKGRIGEVSDVNKEKATVAVKDVNMQDVSIPDWIQQEDNFQPLQAVGVAIPITDVRLVHPLPHPETGELRDVVIERLQRVRRDGDDKNPDRKDWDDDRAVVGTNIKIPWPHKREPQYEDYPDDTLRAGVEEYTFQPCLLYPPMPMSVIDELRNKYSKFRTRHDYEYVQKKEAEDARAEKRKELGKSMRTPLQEMADLRAKQKAAEERDLTGEQLAKIGEVIAAERAKTENTLRQMGQ